MKIIEEHNPDLGKDSTSIGQSVVEEEVEIVRIDLVQDAAGGEGGMIIGRAYCTIKICITRTKI